MSIKLEESKYMAGTQLAFVPWKAQVPLMHAFVLIPLFNFYPVLCHRPSA